MRSKDEVKGDRPGAETKEEELRQDHEAKEMEVAKKQRSRRRTNNEATDEARGKKQTGKRVQLRK